MASPASIAALAPFQFNSHTARLAVAKAQPTLRLLRANRALAKAAGASKDTRTPVTGHHVAAIVSDATSRLTKVEAAIAELRKERAPLSKRDYIDAGVQRTLGPAINPPPWRRGRKSKPEVAPTPPAMPTDSHFVPHRALGLAPADS